MVHNGIEYGLMQAYAEGCDILKNAKQPMFLVCVSDQVRRLDESPRKPIKAEAVAAGSRRSARSA